MISDREPGLPFSKGLMASQVMVTGLSPYRAYQVAEAIEDRLREQGLVSITSDELSDVALARHHRDRRRPLREELRPLARGRAAWTSRS